MGSSVGSSVGFSVLLVLALVSSAVPAHAAGQEGLDSVDALAAAGRTEEARAVLETWWDSERSQSSRRDRQRGLWLRAVLTVDPGMAGLDYQRLVVEYPGGPYSGGALVRLAMIAGSEADLLRAASHFRTLLQDYPRSSERVRARQWLAAHSEEIEEAEAAAALAAQAAAALAAEAAQDSAAAAADSAAVTTQDTAAVQAAADSVGEVAPEVDEPRVEVGRYAVQFGAFSTQERAYRLSESLARAGLETRVVRVRGSPLVRVRVGRFAERGAASDFMAEIERMGYDAAVVSDVAEEEPIA